jgi:hypothetical protein
MNPDLDVRLKSVLKSLSEVILPAIPVEQRLAREQANLVIGHLTIVAEQWKHALNYELENLSLASALASELSGLSLEPALGGELTAAVAETASLDRSDYDLVSAAHRALKALIERLIAEDHSGAALPREIITAVLQYNARRAPRERIWHRGASLDPDTAKLPPISALFPREPR